MANYQMTLDEQTLQRLFTGDRQLVHLLEAVLNQVLEAQVGEQLHAKRQASDDETAREQFHGAFRNWSRVAESKRSGRNPDH